MKRQGVADDLENAATRAPRPVVCGLYLLFAAHQLVYVGRSNDCYRRIAEHRSHGRPFDYALVAACPAGDAGWLESAMLAAMAPPQNRQGPPSVRAIPIATVANPLAALTRAKAIVHARAYGLETACKGALKSGDLPSFPASPTSPIRLVTMGDLTAWCEATQRSRIAAKPNVSMPGGGI